MLVRDFDTLGIVFYNPHRRYKSRMDSVIMPVTGLSVNKIIYTYEYDYQEKILVAGSNWTGGLWVNYYADYALDFMLITTKGDGLKGIHEFYYNPGGLLVKECVKIFAPGLRETHTIFIDYEDAKGNEDFLFSTYNWRYNFYLGVKTYYEYLDARY